MLTAIIVVLLFVVGAYFFYQKQTPPYNSGQVATEATTTDKVAPTETQTTKTAHVVKELSLEKTAGGSTNVLTILSDGSVVTLENKTNQTENRIVYDDFNQQIQIEQMKKFGQLINDTSFMSMSDSDIATGESRHTLSVTVITPVGEITHKVSCYNQSCNADFNKIQDEMVNYLNRNWFVQKP